MHSSFCTSLGQLTSDLPQRRVLHRFWSPAVPAVPAVPSSRCLTTCSSLLLPPVCCLFVLPFLPQTVGSVTVWTASGGKALFFFKLKGDAVQTCPDPTDVWLVSAGCARPGRAHQDLGDGLTAKVQLQLGLLAASESKRGLTLDVSYGTSGFPERFPAHFCLLCLCTRLFQRFRSDSEKP